MEVLRFVVALGIFLFGAYFTGKLRGVPLREAFARGAAQAPGGLARAVDALRFQHGARAGMNGAAYLVVVRGGRGDGETSGQAAPPNKVPHDELGHRGPADVAVAHE